MNLCFIVVILLSQLLHCEGRGIPPVRLLDGEFCNRTCGGRDHTLCPPRKWPKCPYDNFALLDMNLNKFRLNLTLGHNGLRNRIASIMKAANMLTLEWDSSLEEMATNNARHCRPFEDDPCMNEGPELNHTQGTDYYNVDVDVSMYVVQNRFCLATRSYDMELVQLALNSWYMDKNYLQPPTFTVYSLSQKYIGTIEGENNFTHLAFPFTFRFGCSVARFGGHFCVSCMYAPSYRGMGKTMVFDSGIPTSRCTYLHPLQDYKFESLCGRGEPAKDDVCRMPATMRTAYLLPLFMVLAFQ